MTGKDLEREVRYAIDKVMRTRLIQDEFEADRYQEFLDAITHEVMTVFWTAD